MTFSASFEHRVDSFTEVSRIGGVQVAFNKPDTHRFNKNNAPDGSLSRSLSKTCTIISPASSSSSKGDQRTFQAPRFRAEERERRTRRLHISLAIATRRSPGDHVPILPPSPLGSPYASLYTAYKSANADEVCGRNAAGNKVERWYNLSHPARGDSCSLLEAGAP